MKKNLLSIIIILILFMNVSGCNTSENLGEEQSSNLLLSSDTSSSLTKQTTVTDKENNKNKKPSSTTKSGKSTIVKEFGKNFSKIPDYSGEPYTEINNNKPYFTSVDLSSSSSYEYYSELDDLGRCGVTIACVGKDIMPSEERGPIGQVKPSGWHTIKYDCVDGKYLYNRCHLIGYQLTGENANPQNLITGTRYLNVEGMLPFENMVADYVENTNNHVLYRVTPDFKKNNLLASGVEMEAYSIEDSGDGVCFNVYCYNVQPQVTIDYANGDSYYAGNETIDKNTIDTHSISKASQNTVSKQNQDAEKSNQSISTYVINKNTKKFHLPSCNSTKTISKHNKQIYKGGRDGLTSQGYDPCKNCNP